MRWVRVLLCRSQGRSTEGERASVFCFISYCTASLLGFLSFTAPLGDAVVMRFARPVGDAVAMELLLLLENNRKEMNFEYGLKLDTFTWSVVCRD